MEKKTVVTGPFSGFEYELIKSYSNGKCLCSVIVFGMVHEVLMDKSDLKEKNLRKLIQNLNKKQLLKLKELIETELTL